MEYKQLISPEFRITLGDQILKSGIEVECLSSKESHLDWCRVELSNELLDMLTIHDMDEALVELGYEDDYDALIEGYVRQDTKDYWKEILIKDDMIRLERAMVKGTFLDCEPQDVVKYILTCAGVTDYQLTGTPYGKKKRFTIGGMTAAAAIAEVNAAWGISVPFYFQSRVFYWGVTKEQEDLYILEEDESILRLNKYGTLWEAETLGIPWIHHSQLVEVRHNKFSGIAEVTKTILRSDSKGAVRMFIYFEGGEQDV